MKKLFGDLQQPQVGWVGAAVLAAMSAAAAYCYNKKGKGEEVDASEGAKSSGALVRGKKPKNEKEGRLELDKYQELGTDRPPLTGLDPSAPLELIEEAPDVAPESPTASKLTTTNLSHGL